MRPRAIRPVVYYLDRHIAVDSEEHGPMAFEMVDLVCGDDPKSWQEAEAAARRHIESRIRLWDGALAAMDQVSVLRCSKSA